MGPPTKYALVDKLIQQKPNLFYIYIVAQAIRKNYLPYNTSAQLPPCENSVFHSHKLVQPFSGFQRLTSK